MQSYFWLAVHGSASIKAVSEEWDFGKQRNWQLISFL